jgi:hypothetical protein
MLARAPTSSEGIAFLLLGTADMYMTSYVGNAKAAVRRAFDLARSAAPSVLYFDKIDASSMVPTGATGAAAAMAGVTVWNMACPRRCRDFEQAYTKMSTKGKDLKQRMAEIDQAGASNKQSMPPSLTPM